MTNTLAFRFTPPSEIFCAEFLHKALSFLPILVWALVILYNIKFYFIYKNTCIYQITFIFIYDICPESERANVVYKYQCSCDTNKFYIGKTKRHLALRVKEHKSSGAISSHVSRCESCNVNLSNFKVVDSANSDFVLKIKEALHIKMEVPPLNAQLFRNGSEFVLSIF